MRFIFNSLSAVLLLGVVVSACGGKDGSEVNGGNGDGKGASSSGGSLNLDPNGNGLGGPGSPGTIVPDEACGVGTASANLAGVNMLVMFDRSTSMHDPAGDSGATRWELASAALDAFFASNNAAGLNLALRFFPHDMPAAGCNQQECSTEACAQALVNLGTLTAAAAPGDAHEKALLDATAAATPAPRNQGGGMMGMMSGGTPISAALSGAASWATTQHTKTPNENTVIVLVTDGEPNGCDENIGRIAQIAAAALDQDGTRTYAIGLTGSQEADMDRIAMAGGTEQGIFVADGANTTQDLLDALGAIRGEILDCDFPLPEASGGVEVEPALVNVNFTPSSGTKSRLVQVTGEAGCANGDWYYDDIANPTRIVLCKNTCDAVTTDAKASLEILLGCATSTDVPK
jgi:von Willebrand factor type A domain